MNSKKYIFLVRSICLCLLFLCSGVELASAQTNVYPAESFTELDRLLRVDKTGHVLPGNSFSWSESLVSVEGNKIYKGFSTSFFDLLYTERAGKLYLGDSTFSGDILYTFDREKIYKGDGTFPMDCVITYREGRIYKGDSTNFFDLLYTLGDQPPTVGQLFAILLVLEEI